MITYVDDKLFNYIPREYGLVINIADNSDTDMHIGDVRFVQKQYAIWVSCMKVVEDEKRLCFKGTRSFHERIGCLGFCMYEVRDWVLDMKSKGLNFTIITNRIDIGTDDCWGVIETAMEVCWDGLDVVVCDG
jgi:hypothetical protein